MISWNSCRGPKFPSHWHSVRLRFSFKYCSQKDRLRICRNLFKTSNFQKLKVVKCMYFGQSYLECSAWCLSVCHQKNEQNGKSNSEEYGRKKVSIAHWTSTEKLSIMGPNPIWIRNWYFFFLFIHLRFHKLPSYYFRKSWAYFGTWHFGKRHFGTDISSRGFFSTRTFQHWYISAQWTI